MINLTRAKEFYLQLKSKLKGNEGKMVAIEAESGDYFIGENTLDAYQKARKKYPQKEFFFQRVGAKAAYTVGTIERK